MAYKPGMCDTQFKSCIIIYYHVSEEISNESSHHNNNKIKVPVLDNESDILLQPKTMDAISLKEIVGEIMDFPNDQDCNEPVCSRALPSILRS